MAAKPFRHRHDGWTPERQQRFLKILAQTGCVADAASAVGLTTTSAYRAKGRMPAFAAGWALALESVAPVLYAAAYERAVEGWVEDVWYAGKVVGTRRRYDQATLRFLIERGNRAGPKPALSEAQRLDAAHAAARAVGMVLAPKVTSADTDERLRATLDRLAARPVTAEHARHELAHWTRQLAAAEARAGTALLEDRSAEPGD